MGLGRALDAEHPGARHGRELDRGLADLAVGAEHEDDVARLHAAGLAQALVGGDEGHAHGTRLAQRDRRRLHPHMRGIEDEVACMAAVAADAELAARAPDLLAEQVGGPVDDHAGVVAARRARPDRVRHRAEHGLDVARVDPGGGDLDHDLAGPGRRAAGPRARDRDGRCRRPSRSPGWRWCGMSPVGGRQLGCGVMALVACWWWKVAAALGSRPRIARASAGVAIWPPRSSTMRRAFSTSAALEGASTPRAR